MAGKKSFLICMLFLFVIVNNVFVSAATFSGSSSSASYSSYQINPNYETYYSASAGGGLGTMKDTYWPILGGEQTCENRQDIVLFVPPAGCQPSVVRSDLLEEQNVPVFCKVDSLKINPLIDIKQINNIVFNGKTPPEIAGVGFHPNRAALRTRDRLLGDPLVNSIGYVVVVLKKQPDESKMSDFVNVTLQAQLQYAVGNAYGIGRAEFVLQPVSEDKWKSERFKQSFWNGRYFLRLEKADSNYVDISIYQGDKKVTTFRVERGKTSSVVYVPGMYCQAGVQAVYDGLVESDENKATIEVSSDLGTDLFDVYQGMRFSEECYVSSIVVDENGETGKVIGSCAGNRFELVLSSIKDDFDVFFENGKMKEPKLSSDQSEVTIDLTKLEGSRAGTYKLDSSNNLKKIPVGGSEFIAVDSNDNPSDKIAEGDKNWVLKLKKALKNYKIEKLKDSFYAPSVLRNKNLSSNVKNYYSEAIKDYYSVAENFPSEKMPNSENYYGEQSLINAIDLARVTGADKDRAKLINKYLETYPEGLFNEELKNELNEIYKIDSTKASEVIQFKDRARTIRLVRLKSASLTSKATFTVDRTTISVSKNDTVILSDGNRKFGEMKLEKIRDNGAQVSVFCIEKNSNGEESLSLKKQVFDFVLNGQAQSVCGLSVRLVDVDLEQLAKIRLIPWARGTQTVTNVSVSIGIEKRNIKLTPDKAIEKIENLNKSIEKWEKISKQLGTVVMGMKAACFATSGILTFKNFMAGLSGESLARQQVMQTWKPKCDELVAKGVYANREACYLAKSSEIDSDVAKTTNVIKKINEDVKNIQNKHVISSGIFGKSVDSDAVRKELAAKAREKYGTNNIDVSQLRTKWRDKDGNPVNSVSVNEIFSEENVNGGLVTTEDIKEIMLYSELQNTKGVSQFYLDSTKNNFVNVAERVSSSKKLDEELKKSRQYEKEGLPSAFVLSDVGNLGRKVMNVKEIGDSDRNSFGFTNDKIKHISTVVVPARGGYQEGYYVLGLTEGEGKVYSISEVVKKTDGGYEKIDDVGIFGEKYGIGLVESTENVGYSNEIVQSDRKVRYYETAPYKGLPAIVPFDVKEGWYAATKQTIPVFGNIGAYDESGRVTSYWLCNVGKNGRIEFETGFGDDLCQQINLNTGQPLGVFPGLSETKARNLINQGVQAIQDAANQYGNKKVKINRQVFDVGLPSTGKPGAQCQDFMSPKDCLLLFNICDPVICPASRCDLGGQFPVANVPQTGIIGSIVLCLPNIREGIAIPVCLTGIQSGIDAFVSIMKNYRDCLQENVETGKMVGICDQIYSVYLCDFFWNQIAPFIDVLVPKMIEMAYGQGARGGAEYLTVQTAWQNMQNSMNYFTQTYAVNSMQAFQARSEGKFAGFSLGNTAISEIGSKLCQAFPSVKAPDAFKTLIQPDSPPQFYAWFDSATYTTATVPATSRYKVFYHIFAGKDSGVYFDVYLKNPPGSSYYAIAQTVQVASGYVQKGGYASNTKDFTAPSGYKELCVRVNNQEECGFKQVSTSLALKYINDQYVANQMLNKVSSEKECVGGSSSAFTMLNPNLQSGVEETISPRIYNRGIIRICASENPGKGTDMTRFVDVGYCDNPKIRCWLDKNSVDKAISANDYLVKNKTLQEIEENIKNSLFEDGTFMNPDSAAANLSYIEEMVELFNGDINQAKDIINSLDLLEPKLVMNYQKAWRFLLRGRTNDKVVRYLLLKEPKEKVKEEVKEEKTKETIDEYNKNEESSIPNSFEEEKEIKHQETDSFLNYDEAISVLEKIMDEEGGSYSYGNNKAPRYTKFVDNLFSKDLITEKEYNEINGKGFFNLAEKSNYVLNLLKKKRDIEKAKGKKYALVFESETEYTLYKEGNKIGEGAITDSSIKFSGNEIKVGNKVVGNIVDGKVIINEYGLNQFTGGTIGEALNEINGTKYPDFIKEETKDNKKYFKLNSKGRIELDGKEISPPIFVEGNRIYYSSKLSLVGAILNDGRMNIQTNLASGASEEIKNHLNFLNGKSFNDLKSSKGILCDSEEDKSC